MSATRRPTFRPRLWPTLGTLAALALLLSLGTWQYRRYEEKLALEITRSQRLDVPPVTLQTLEGRDLEELNYRNVTVRGRLDPSRTILFKHRQLQKRPGFWLASPLRLESGGVLLVNRGWVPFDRGAELAEQLPGSAEPADYTGLLHLLPRNIPDTKTRQALARGQLDLTSGPSQWDTYDVEGIYEALPQEPVHERAVLVLGPSHSGDPFPVASAEHVTQPYMTAERHKGYFIFWFTTAGALVMLYLAASFGLVGSWRVRASELEQRGAGQAT